MNDWRSRFLIPSSADAVAGLVSEISKKTREIGLGSSESFQLSVCLAELLNNIVEHAHDKDGGEDIEIMLHICPETIEIQCQDWGLPFVPNNAVADTVSPTEGGRGMQIIRAWCDDYRVAHEPQGNLHTLTRTRL